mgnify:CR=1 FL=1
MYKMIKGASPYFSNSDIKSLIKKFKLILKTNELTTGKYTKIFENYCKKMANCKYAISVNSGGSALELAVSALKKNKKIDVLVPTETFAATASAPIRAGCNVIFADINPNTLCLDLNTIKKSITKKTKIIIYVHMFGIITRDVIEIRKYCKKKKIFLIKAAAHAHGGYYKNFKVGTIGDIGCFSYHATKILTTGEGGLITTNSKKIAKKILSLRNHGKDNKNNKIINVSNNYRISEITSLLGIYQQRKLNSFLNHRKKIASIYRSFFKINKNVKLIDPLPYSGHTYWRYSLILNNKINRKDLQIKMKNDHKTRVTWMYEPLVHQQPVFKKNRKYKLKNAEKICGKLINLPTHLYVKTKDAVRISRAIKKIINSNN